MAGQQRRKKENIRDVVKKYSIDKIRNLGDSMQLFELFIKMISPYASRNQYAKIASETTDFLLKSIPKN